MYIPDKAIITAKTEAEAERLLDFLQSNGCTWLDDSSRWSVYQEDMCYDIEPDKRIMFADRVFYEMEIDSLESGEQGPYDQYGFIPEDPALRFISTDDFISMCCGENTDAADSNVDISALM